MPGLNYQSIPVVCSQLPLQVSQTGGFPYQRNRYSPRLVLIVSDLRRSGLLLISFLTDFSYFPLFLVSGGTTSDFLNLCYILSCGIGRLCCWLKGVPNPGPVQGIVVPAVTLDRYGCIPRITATLHNVLIVSFLLGSS